SGSIMLYYLYCAIYSEVVVLLHELEVLAKFSMDGKDLKICLSKTEVSTFLKMLSAEHSFIAQACAVEYFRRLLVHDSSATTEIVDNLIKELIRCVRINYGSMQRDAAWAITNLACWPHAVCEQIIAHNGIAALMECAQNTDDEVREQAIWAIGNIASDCPSCRLAVRRSNVLSTIINILHKPQFSHSKHKRNIIWAMTQILRGGSPHIPPAQTQAALNGLLPLLYDDDEKLRSDATWGVAYLANSFNEGEAINMVLETIGLLERLLGLLDDPNTVDAALRAIGNIVAGDDEQTQRVIDAGVLPKLGKLLKESTSASQRKELVWIVSNIAAGTHSQIDALFDRNNGDFVTMLVEAGQGDDVGVRKEAGWAVANALTGASVAKTHWLCASNLLRVVPFVLRMDTDPTLIERLVYALEIVTRRCAIYLPVFTSYGIMESFRNILIDGDHIDPLTRQRAERFINEKIQENDRRYGPVTYEFVR
uniref:Importin subunit alpha n=1 Tax=Parascaris univalens TaxID=6257 RepID=A0A915AHD8_PARUN